MELSEIKTIKEFSSNHYADWEITKKIQNDGWIVISTRVKRDIDSDGKFEDELVCTLGHVDSNP